MLNATVLYWDHAKEIYKIELRSGETYDSTNPKDWGLPFEDRIIAVFQQASFLQAWVNGVPYRKY